MYLRRFQALVISLVAGLALLPVSAGAAHADELIPLPPPGQPVASSITATGATLTWTRPDGPVFRYSMKQLVNGEWVGYASMPSNTITLAGLNPNTEYTFAVLAAALYGSGYTTSPLSEPVTFTTLPGKWSCNIQIYASGGYFTANGRLVWSGPAPTPSWVVAFTIPSNLTIQQAWNGYFTHNGAAGSITGGQSGNNPPPGSPIWFGFSGRYTGTFIPPADFMIVGLPCEVTIGRQ